jgi:hypothetical protein
MIYKSVVANALLTVKFHKTTLVSFAEALDRAVLV